MDTCVVFDKVLQIVRQESGIPLRTLLRRLNSNKNKLVPQAVNGLIASGILQVTGTGQRKDPKRVVYLGAQTEAQQATLRMIEDKLAQLKQDQEAKRQEIARLEKLYWQDGYRARLYNLGQYFSQAGDKNLPFLKVGRHLWNEGYRAGRPLVYLQGIYGDWADEV